MVSLFKLTGINMEEERLIPSEEKKFQRPKSSPSARDTVTGSVAVRRPFTASSVSGGVDLLPRKLVQDGGASLQDMDETSRKQIIDESSDSVGKSEALVHDNVKHNKTCCSIALTFSLIGLVSA